MHIPLPEYLYTNDDDVKGFVGESVAAQSLNTGLFDALIE